MALPKPSSDGTSDTALFLKSMKDPDIIERVRVTIKNAHVFKLPPRQTVSVGWRGADWKEKVWQGTVKVVERGEQTAILLVDRVKGSIFAVCPVKAGAVDRCIDSSRYFVLRIENATGRHMFIGVAFNERNDAFDFNTALEDSRREKELEKMPIKPYTGPTKDYSIKEGEKIHVAIPKVSNSGNDSDSGDMSESSGNEFSSESTAASRKAIGQGKKRLSKVGSPKGGLLAPSSKDTPSRVMPQTKATTNNLNLDETGIGNGNENFGELFPGSFGGGGGSITDSQQDDPFFSSTGNGAAFDPRRYKTGTKS